mmetsp:Transcript_6398/g.7142  ORF Transcript_6398/g.7142 Transcript_6398/m.7142 type:complete len:228 (+) Transcript_6398:3-686(+)
MRHQSVAILAQVTLLYSCFHCMSFPKLVSLVSFLLSITLFFNGCASTRSNFVPITPASPTNGPNGSTTDPWAPTTTPGDDTTTRTTAKPGSSSTETGNSPTTQTTTSTPDNTPYTCDSATPAIVGTYGGSFSGQANQGISLQFAQPKKIGVMAGSYNSAAFSYSNIYYEFVSGQSWFSLRPFDHSQDLLSLFNLQSMEQVRVYISHQCEPVRIDFGSTASASLSKEV